MIEVALIIVSAALLATLSLIGWQIYRGDSRADQLTAERAAHSATTLESERRGFEIAALKQQIARETQRANAFEEALADVQANPNSDLDRADVRGRVRRAAQQARDAAARRSDPVFAGADAAVPATTGATVAGPTAVPGKLDPNEDLR